MGDEQARRKLKIMGLANPSPGSGRAYRQGGGPAGPAGEEAGGAEDCGSGEGRGVEDTSGAPGDCMGRTSLSGTTGSTVSSSTKAGRPNIGATRFQ